MRRIVQLAAFAAVLGSASAAAQDFFGSLDPTAQKPGVQSSVSWRMYPDADLKGLDEDIGLAKSSVRVNAMLWKDGKDSLSLSTSVGLLGIDSAALSPSGGRPYPLKLWNVVMGLGIQQDVGKGCTAGGNVSVSSSSDEPFGTLDETGFSISLSLRIPQGDSAWLVFLYYGSSGGELSRIPFPSVGFFWKPCEEFQALLGMPFFMIHYRPWKMLMFHASYFPLTQVRAGVMCFLLVVLLHAGVSWTNEGFYLAGRDRRSDQLLYYQKEITAGATVHFGRGASAAFTAGYAFDREFREGRAWWGSYDRAPVRNGWFVAVEGSFRFN